MWACERSGRQAERGRGVRAFCVPDQRNRHKKTACFFGESFFFLHTHTHHDDDLKKRPPSFFCWFLERGFCELGGRYTVCATSKKLQHVAGTLAAASCLRGREVKRRVLCCLFLSRVHAAQKKAAPVLSRLLCSALLPLRLASCTAHVFCFCFCAFRCCCFFLLRENEEATRARCSVLSAVLG